jgi:hypothetical protein
LTPEPPAPAPATEGLDPLDRDRAGSLAYEGGASGASVEGPDAPAPPEGDQPEPRRLPGNDEITPAFDEDADTPVMPRRLRRAARGDRRK